MTISNISFSGKERFFNGGKVWRGYSKDNSGPFTRYIQDYASGRKKSETGKTADDIQRLINWHQGVLSGGKKPQNDELIAKNTLKQSDLDFLDEANRCRKQCEGSGQ